MCVVEIQLVKSGILLALGVGSLPVMRPKESINYATGKARWDGGKGCDRAIASI